MDNPAGFSADIQALLDKLNDRQRRFVLSYVVHLNASRASREAGYETEHHEQIGFQNLRKLDIKAAIEAILEGETMSVAEGLRRLTDWGRGNISHFTTPNGHLDLSTQQAQENLHLVKKIKVTKRVERTVGDEGDPKYADIISTEIELHDAKDAVVKTLEAHGKLIHRIGNPDGSALDLGFYALLKESSIPLRRTGPNDDSAPK
ncbi:MAG: terminase small subunit [Spirosoma sp.]|nr:terminase small subunit [Spirosoma sp.]